MRIDHNQTTGLPPEIAAALTAHREVCFNGDLYDAGERAQIDAIRHLATELHTLQLAFREGVQAAPKKPHSITLTEWASATLEELKAPQPDELTRLREENVKLKASLEAGQRNCDDAYEDLRTERDEARAEVAKLKAELQAAREKGHAEARQGIAKRLEALGDVEVRRRDDTGQPLGVRAAAWHTAITADEAVRIARNWKPEVQP